MGNFDHGTARILWEEEGAGDPVLLLPGIMGELSDHAFLRRLLSPRFRVIAAELPGWGGSLPQPRPYHPGYYREDAETMLALLDHLDAAPAHVVGFSDGGEVAMIMAALQPQKVRSLLVWGASGVLHDPDRKVRGMFERLMDDPPPELAGLRAHLVRRYGEDFPRASLRSAVSAWDAIVEAGGDIGFSLADRIACPVLLAVGERDDFVRAEDARALARRITKARPIEVEGAGHVLHQERPEWFKALATEWLAGA